MKYKYATAILAIVIAFLIGFIIFQEIEAKNEKKRIEKNEIAFKAKIDALNSKINEVEMENEKVSESYTLLKVTTENLKLNFTHVAKIKEKLKKAIGEQIYFCNFSYAPGIMAACKQLEYRVEQVWEYIK
jgi:predicted nuclease with TOPRIM domain